MGIGKFDQTPKSNIEEGVVDAEYIKPDSHVPALSADKQNLISWIGNRKGTPEPKACYELNGINDHVVYAYDSVFNFGADGATNNPAFSLSAWIFMDAASTFRIASRGTDNNAEHLFTFDFDGSARLRILVAQDGSDILTDRMGRQSTTQFYDYQGQWIFVAAAKPVTTNSTFMNIYAWDKEGKPIDLGPLQQLGIGTFANQSDAQTPLYIGKNTNSSNGKIFDFRMYNVSLTEEGLFDKGFGAGRFKTDTEVFFDKTDVKSGLVSYNSIGSNKTGTIVADNESAFHYIGTHVPYSFHNNFGFNKPLNTYIPRDESNPTKDVLGNELLKKGKLNQLAKITNVNVGNPDGIGDVLAFDDLTGITIVSSLGTSTPTINGNDIQFTAGTIWGLMLSNGSHLTFNEGSGLRVYDISGNSLHGTWPDTASPTVWAKSDIAVDYRLANGFRKYDISNIDFTDPVGVLRSTIGGFLDLDNPITPTKFNFIGVSLTPGVRRSGFITIVPPDQNNETRQLFSGKFTIVINELTGFVDQPVGDGTTKTQITTDPNVWEVEFVNVAETSPASRIRVSDTTIPDQVTGTLEVNSFEWHTLFPSNISSANIDILSNPLTYKGIEKEKYFPVIDSNIDFQYYQAADDSLDPIINLEQAYEQLKLVFSKSANSLRKIVSGYSQIAFDQIIGGYVGNNALIMLIRTNASGGISGNNQFELAAFGTYSIDWGDGTIETNVSENKTHTYLVEGDYEVKILSNGLRPDFYLRDSPKLIEIRQWGNVVYTSLLNGFRRAVNLDITATDVLKLPADCRGTFEGCSKLVGNDSIKKWDTRSGAQMQVFWQNCVLFNIDIGEWRFDNLTTIRNMFQNTPFNHSVNDWDVSQVTDFTFVFADTSDFNQPLNNWDVSNGTNFTGMFDGAAVFNQDITNWNMSSAVSIATMFRFAPLFNQNINNWDVSNVTSISAMFFGATAFQQSLSTWVTSSLISINQAFILRPAETVLDISSWDVSQLTNADSVFSGTGSISTAILDDILDVNTGWASQTVQSGVFFDVNTPNPFTGTRVDNGTTDSTTLNKLVDSTQNFVTTVNIGDVVVNKTNNIVARVTAIDSDTILSLDTDIMISGEDYDVLSSDAAKGWARLIIDFNWSFDIQIVPNYTF